MVAKADSVIYIEGHRKWYVAGLVVSILIFAWAVYVAKNTPLAGWEYSWLLKINSWPNSWFRVFEIIMIALGSIWTAVAAVVLTYFLKHYRLSWRLAANVLLASILFYLIRHVVNRPYIEKYIYSLHVRYMLAGSTFPSYTAVIATVVSLSILPYLKKKNRVIIPVWLTAVALADLYLVMHAPVDILGGFALGLFTVSLIRIIPQSLKVFLRLD